MQWSKHCRAKQRGLLVLFLLSVASLGNAEEVALYVSPDGNDSWAGDSLEKPFATIQRARDAIRAMKKEAELTGPVVVYLRGGTYELSETLVFTPEDSGTEAYSITYTAYQDEKPVVSGGRRIVGPWKDYRGQIKVCTLPAVKEGKWRFRQLFLGGERQNRARMPNDSYDKNGTFYQIDGSDAEEDLGKDAFKYRDQDFKKWKNLEDVEVVLFHSWNESRLPIAELDEEEKVVTFTGPIGRNVESGNRYYIDNVLEGLDEAGEWYLDRHTGELYYWPPGDLKDAELRAPVLKELVRFAGDPEKNNYVQHIHIRGLTFCDADYTVPKEGIPTIRDVGDIWFPSAITMKGTSDCVFENNTIRNTGTYGLDLTGDANLITGNEIYDTGSGGIITRSYGKLRNVISYNHIHHGGLVFHSGVGINIDDGGGLIANNLIHHTSHSGIYARHFPTAYGQEAQRRNQEQGLIIEYNEIHDVMQMVSDGGGIFVRDDHIWINNNLIYNIMPNSDAYAIYLGCETRNCLVENNVVHDVGMFGQYVWRDNKNNTIFNNIYVGATNPVAFINPTDKTHRSEQIRFIRNIVYFSDPKADVYIFPWFGGDERSLPMECDYNIIYHTEGKELHINGYEGVDTLADWKKLGLDRHSVVADPLFVDPENHDYSLRPESPALKMGFKPIDLSRVGLRGRSVD
ncbi:MAG: right-handed parallel beta-helix repeat-containing protein [Candidatus Brocadiales bacterium]|nr:right-handed parallel beta-helix repeat-containing protein [Candidatus Bathyanammoxibius sp.]